MQTFLNHYHGSCADNEFGSQYYYYAEPGSYPQKVTSQSCSGGNNDDSVSIAYYTSEACTGPTGNFSYSHKPSPAPSPRPPSKPAGSPAPTQPPSVSPTPNPISYNTSEGTSTGYIIQATYNCNNPSSFVYASFQVLGMCSSGVCVCVCVCVFGWYFVLLRVDLLCVYTCMYIYSFVSD